MRLFFWLLRKKLALGRLEKEEGTKVCLAVKELNKRLEYIDVYQPLIMGLAIAVNIIVIRGMMWE